MASSVGNDERGTKYVGGIDWLVSLTALLINARIKSMIMLNVSYVKYNNVSTVSGSAW